MAAAFRESLRSEFMMLQIKTSRLYWRDGVRSAISGPHAGGNRLFCCPKWGGMWPRAHRRQKVNDELVSQMLWRIIPATFAVNISVCFWTHCFSSASVSVSSLSSSFWVPVFALSLRCMGVGCVFSFDIVGVGMDVSGSGGW